MKRGYIIFDCIDIQCEILPVPFSELSKMKPVIQVFVSP